jgi:hypothetical protein
MVEKVVVGEIGTVCYALFTLICLTRTFQIWRIVKSLQQLKLLFHLALSLNAIFDLIYSASLLSNRSVTIFVDDFIAFFALGI